MKEKKQSINDDELLDKEISDFLASYTVECVDEDRIEETIDILRAYMPKKREKFVIYKLIKNQITYVDRWYWIISMLILLSGMLIISKEGLSSYLGIILFSPLTMLIGMIELVKGKRNKMWELEKSFKYSFRKVIMSRLLIIISFSCVINLSMAVFLSIVDTSTKLVVLNAGWIMSLLLTTSINLISMKYIINEVLTMSIGVFWMVLLWVMNEKIVSLFNNINGVVIFCSVLITIIIFIVSLINFYKKSIWFGDEVAWN